MDRGSFLSAVAALGATAAFRDDRMTGNDRMTSDQRIFIEEMCKKYDINPQAWSTEEDALNVALMMIDLLWGHARTLEMKVARLEEAEYNRTH